MFLQKLRPSPQREPPAIAKTHDFRNLTDVLKKMSTHEIKRHQKKNYYNPRTFLIENTKKVIRTVSKETKENLSLRQTQRSEELFSSEGNRELRSKNSADLSNREARKAAVKSFRQRIWKSSDIASIMRTQEQRLLSNKKASEMIDRQFYDSQTERVERYQVKMRQFDKSASKEERDAARKQWMIGAVKNTAELRSHSNNRNPEQLMITNIEFKQELDQTNAMNSQKLWNRERKKDHRRMLHFSFLKDRPNTTGGINRLRSDENVIEPW